MGKYQDELRGKVELARVVVPPHVRVRKGKRQNVEGYTYNRRGGMARSYKARSQNRPRAMPSVPGSPTGEKGRKRNVARMSDEKLLRELSEAEETIVYGGGDEALDEFFDRLMAEAVARGLDVGPIPGGEPRALPAKRKASGAERAIREARSSGISAEQILLGKRKATGGGQAMAYVRRIKNPGKRRYADDYLRWLLSGQKGEAPKPPAGLSYMGAQAVRLALADFMK